MPRAGLAALLDAMRTVDPATPVWTFSRSDPTATFWHRRMAHETVVQGVDAEQATGTVGPLDPALVLDGIAESLEVFAPLMARREQDPATATVHLHATDVEGEWLVTHGGSTVTVEHGHAKGDAAMRGTAGDLHPWLWGRVPLDRLEVFGDPAIAERLTKLSRVEAEPPPALTERLWTRNGRGAVSQNALAIRWSARPQRAGR